MLTRGSPVVRAFRHRDFRLLWSGAFLSFIGSWVQTVGQGWLVYDITGDKGKLALVAFCGMAPVTVLGPIAGSLVDVFDRRRLLVATQIVFALSALFLAGATTFGFVQYWQILVVALVTGTVGALEMPTRQSVVSRVVPVEDLAAAIPLNALTFNMARLVGPAIGGVLLSQVGPSACYLVNGISYLALILAALAIRADLRAASREPQPIMDLVLDGMRYTFRSPALRGLFLLEGTTSVFGIFYLSQMPAIAVEMLGLGKQGLGAAYVSVGVGSVLSLLLVASTSHRPIKALVIRLSMSVMAVSLLVLSFTRFAPLAFVLFAVLGFCAVAQFNTTNTLFQLLSPDHLRGRVLSMHVWALAGLSPAGVLALGWLAERASLPVSLQLGGGAMLIGAVAAWSSQRGLEEIR